MLNVSLTPEVKADIKEEMKIMEFRYKKQPHIKEMKKRFFSRWYIYPLLVDQEKRNSDNNLLNVNERMRWDRQLMHPLINQKRINEAKIVVFGLGGIGSNVLLGLIYSGIQNFKIIDFDKIELSNLNRQTLYIPEDIGGLKSEKAKKRLLEINPKIDIEALNIKIDYPTELNVLSINEDAYPDEILKIDKLIKWGDYIINAVDYFGAPYLINDLCIKNGKPFYFAGTGYFFGEIYCFSSSKKTACIRCIFGPTDFSNKMKFRRYKRYNSQKGVVIGTTCINTGNFISEMIIRDICNIHNPFHGHYFMYDAFNFEIHRVPAKVNEKCECRNFL